MNLTKKITFTLAVFAAASVSHAQSSTAEQPNTPAPPAQQPETTAEQPPSADISGGTLGKRYVDLNFGAQDIRHVSSDAYDLGAGVNLPVAPGIDLGADYSYGWHNGTPHLRSDIVEGTVTLFPTTNPFSNGVKPFVAGGIGYQWNNASFVGNPRTFSFTSNDDYGIWDLAAGLEFPVGALSITPAVTYSDDFQSSAKSVQAFGYGAQANYWLTNQVGLYAGVAYEDFRHSDSNAWDYTTGVRLKF